jgi:hypothetical protein
MGSIWLGEPGARWTTAKDTIETMSSVQAFRWRARKINGSIAA